MKSVKQNINKGVLSIYFKCKFAAGSSVNDILFYKIRVNLLRKVETNTSSELSWKIKIAKSYRS